MKTKLLLPRWCRLAGGIMLPFAFAWFAFTYFGNQIVFPFLGYHKDVTGDLIPPGFIFDKDFHTDFNGELSLLFTMVCLFMIAFSRQKKEDEYVKMIRLGALQVSIYTNYILLAIASVFYYNFSYLLILQISVFTLPVIFIIVFYFNLHLRSRFLTHSPA